MNLRIQIIMVLALAVAGLAGGIGISACVVTPVDAIEAAATTIEWARSAQAEHYAPELLQRAESDYLAAKAEVDDQERRIKFFRSYKKAEMLLASAENAAREARSRAVAKQKESSKARSAIDLASIELEGASNSMKWVTDSLPQSDIEAMKKTLETLEADLEVAEQLFDSEDYAAARAKAMSVLHQAYEVAGVIREAT